VTVSSYEVRVSGSIPEEVLQDLRVVAQGMEGTQTLLYGEIRDEAALFGLLNRLRGLGLEIVEVRRTPPIEWVEPAAGSAPEPYDAGEDDADEDAP
jgi:hypothetical protein